ncbi:unnamed protein product [Linum tenue]|uniref:ATP-dependent (S)-NAD(P)H-hydrate dehydratase n=1 Tax=Linum tenue TaxID=586396 RepID=A0AAV0P7I4_9ROSI|nr:unnamed protein product [Linum tenue]
MLVNHGMNQLASLSIARSYSFASSIAAVLRRQSFLIRARGGGVHNKVHSTTAGITMQETEADAVSILRAITPTLDPTRHKGQAGKIAVIGGCREYTGAPYFAAISALKIGADLSHVFCTKDAAPVIKSYSPELIVHPVLEESYSWMERFDCLVVGPGLGRDPFLDCVSEIMKQARHSNVPIVVDGDGLFLVANSLHLVHGYPLAVLTPNVNEYKRLVQTVLKCEPKGSTYRLLLVRIGGVTILRKGRSDLISDGDIVNSVSICGSPRRCGGQGDILSGSS